MKVRKYEDYHAFEKKSCERLFISSSQLLWGIQEARFEKQDSRGKIQEARFKRQDKFVSSRFWTLDSGLSIGKIQEARFKRQDSRGKIQEARFKRQDSRGKIQEAR
jgi:hypothetical protein